MPYVVGIVLVWVVEMPAVTNRHGRHTNTQLCRACHLWQHDNRLLLSLIIRILLPLNN